MPFLGSIPPGKGAKKRALRRYLRVKATKPEERGGRESERSIILMKQGNRPEGTLWRERCGGHWDPKVSQRDFKG